MKNVKPMKFKAGDKVMVRRLDGDRDMKTQKSTIIDLITELLNDHREKCNCPRHADEVRPHVISKKWDTNANITLLIPSDTSLRLELDDGSVFVLDLDRGNA